MSSYMDRGGAVNNGGTKGYDSELSRQFWQGNITKARETSGEQKLNHSGQGLMINFIPWTSVQDDYDPNEQHLEVA